MSRDLLDDLEKYKKEYYSLNKKNMLFKNDQKMEIASKISIDFDLSSLIKNTIYVIPGTNKIYIDYNVFKTFAHPTNYAAFIDYMQVLILQCIQSNGTFECILNINSFTVSAAERYKGIIEQFNLVGEKNSTDYVVKMTKLCVHNTPSSVEHIYRIIVNLIDPIVRTKIVFYNKEETTRLYN